MLGKVRPVGSRVYRPEVTAVPACLPWQANYRTYFVNSGTAALSAAVAVAMDRKPVQQPEVLIPAYGCPDLVAAVIAQGALPVLVDLAPDRPWLDMDSLTSSVTPDTVALVAVDFLGIPERLEHLRQWASDQGLMLIEDAAQAFPPTSSETGLADCCVLSFGRGKPINLMGGGALLVREAMGERAERVLRAYPRSEWPGGPRMALKRALFNLLISRQIYPWLERLPFLGIGATVYHPLDRIEILEAPWGWLGSALEQRKRFSDWSELYNALLGPLEKSGWELVPKACGESRGGAGPGSGLSKPLLRYSLLAPDRATRDKAVSALNRAGIGANGFYGEALADIAGVRPLLGSEPSEHPNAKTWASRLLTLPSHEDVQARDIERAVAVLLSIQSGAAAQALG